MFKISDEAIRTMMDLPRYYWKPRWYHGVIIFAGWVAVWYWGIIQAIGR